MIIYFRHLSDDCYRETVACTLNQKFAYYKETSFLSTFAVDQKKTLDSFFFFVLKKSANYLDRIQIWPIAL
jgi:hypothetical protein